MRFLSFILCAVAVVPSSACSQSPEARLRRTLSSQLTGVIHLPEGNVEISSELTLSPGAHDLTVTGPQTVLTASSHFRGRAILSVELAKNIRFEHFSIDGSRAMLAKSLPMAPPENYFRVYYSDNGLLLDRVDGIEITDLHFRNIPNFAALVSRSSRIKMQRISVSESGSINRLGRNNTTGGIVFEEGCSDFEVRESSFSHIRGNALWTHSLFKSNRSSGGRFLSNRFDTIGRDAIQVGHATTILVEDNNGTNIGWPLEAIDVENAGTPVAIDTSGNVDHTIYSRNRFEEIDGKCIDLDGFHDGVVSGNECVNRKPAADYPFGHFGIVMNNANPEMRSANIEIVRNHIDGTKFGALFLIGDGHRVLANTFANLNQAHCNETAKTFGCIFKPDEPEMLEAGIYLGRSAERPAVTRQNVIEGNHISGYKMKSRCILAAPGVALGLNTIKGNACRDR